MTLSFKGLRPASRQAAVCKRMNRSTDSVCEILLRRLLWKHGFRYRKNLRTLAGKPDIVFVKERVAVFCDGDFWHGRHWHALRRKLRVGSNADYWLRKIDSNRERDRRNTILLRRAGWLVIRLWETDIRDCVEAVARHVEQSIIDRRRLNKEGHAVH